MVKSCEKETITLYSLAKHLKEHLTDGGYCPCGAPLFNSASCCVYHIHDHNIRTEDDLVRHLIV